MFLITVISSFSRVKQFSVLGQLNPWRWRYHLFKISGTSHPTTQHHTPDDMNVF